MRDAIHELRISSSQRLIIAIAGLFVLWLIAVGGRAGEITMRVLPLGFIGGLSFTLAYWLLPRRLRMAQVVWIVGFAAIASTAFVEFKSPEIVFLFALIPLMTVLTLGWVAGLGGGVITLVWTAWLTNSVGVIIPASYVEIILWGGAVLAVMGWAALSPLMTSARQLTETNEAAFRELNESRNQKLELEQYQRELIHANTELSRMTDRLKVMTQLAEEARRVKEEFVANVSHELRTPLNMIIGYTELMIKSPKAYARNLPPRLLADLATIHRNSQHLVELINDVLDLSQVDIGRMALTRSWVAVREIVEAAVVAAQPLFQSKGLYLRVTIAEDVQQAYCDATRIREVILNLLSNAGRFTDQGGVDVRATCQDDNLLISITDTGPGIAPQDLKKLFEPFQQLDDALHRGRGGSGLGLSVSKRFVEMHNGRMWVDSEIGKGATFSFSIPLTPTSADGAGHFTRWINPYQDYQERPHVIKPTHVEPAPRLVIVEHEDALQHLFSRYMEGVETIAVSTVDEAVCELERSPAQALIVNAPISQDSLAQIHMTAPLPFNTPIIGCWAPGREEAVKRMGVIRYLLKPISHEALLSALDSVIGSINMVKTVLLVDDDAETLRLFARIISAARPNWPLILTTSGQEALVIMKERRPDVVLLDMVLADIDGFEVLKAKGADDAMREMPVIAVSSTDPAGTPMLSDTLLITRHNRLTTREFLSCVQAIIQVLTSGPRQAVPMQPESSPG